MAVVGYARVSTIDQNLDRQIDALRAYGIDDRLIYREKISGTKRDRPELQRMLRELQQGDTVVVSDLTRISRSTKDLLDIVDQMERDLTSQRTREGLAAAKARGRNGGRPSKQNEKGDMVRALADSGMKIAEIVRQTGLSRSTVNRILRNTLTEDVE